MNEKVSIGLIGLGYWGVNYLRVLMQLKDVRLKYVCDNDYGKLAKCPESINVTKVTDFVKLAEDKDLKAVVIATPASTHYEIAKLMLESGKHVLVEKPLTMNHDQALELCNLSNKMDIILMVGHIYCFNPAVEYMRDVLRDGRLGDLYYGIGLRLGLGPIRKDASCTWDLATHDIAMLDYLIGRMPSLVSAQVASFLQRGIHDYAIVQLTYENDFYFNLITSWYAAEKIRTWYLMGSKGMLKFDDINKNTPITIYNKGVNVTLTKKGIIQSILPKEGDIVLPYIKYEEPLLLQVKHFIESIKNNRRPLTNCEQGVRVVKILEVIEESIKKDGKPIHVI